MWILCLRVPKRVWQIQHQLQGAQESTTLVDKGKGHQKSITQTIADICSFISHKCVHVGAKFFNEEGNLAYGEKCENIRNWTTKLHLQDYMLLDLLISYVNI
jgi:hypothetical protein